MTSADQWRAWRIWRMCGRKRQRFLHESQARRAAHEQGMQAYRCKYCDLYHLTSKPKQPHQSANAG